jgi:hypothetical protein
MFCFHGGFIKNMPLYFYPETVMKVLFFFKKGEGNAGLGVKNGRKNQVG